MVKDNNDIVSAAQVGQMDFLNQRAPEAKRHGFKGQGAVNYYNGYNQEAEDNETAFITA